MSNDQRAVYKYVLVYTMKFLLYVCLVASPLVSAILLGYYVSWWFMFLLLSYGIIAPVAVVFFDEGEEGNWTTTSKNEPSMTEDEIELKVFKLAYEWKCNGKEGTYEELLAEARKCVEGILEVERKGYGEVINAD